MNKWNTASRSTNLSCANPQKLKTVLSSNIKIILLWATNKLSFSIQNLQKQVAHWYWSNPTKNSTKLNKTFLSADTKAKNNFWNFCEFISRAKLIVGTFLSYIRVEHERAITLDISSWLLPTKKCLLPMIHLNTMWTWCSTYLQFHSRVSEQKAANSFLFLGFPYTLFAPKIFLTTLAMKSLFAMNIFNLLNII